MSGTAGLSAAKNRRSGNEVKFNGQSKSIPPPEQTSIQQQPLVRQQNSMPNPMEILKSHEFRLQQLEGENMEQDFLNHKVDFLTLKTEFLTLKNELLINNKINKTNVAEVASSNTNKQGNSDEITLLQQRVGELNTIVANLTIEITSIKQYIREKVDPGLTKMLQIVQTQVKALVPVQAQAPAPVPVQAQAPAPVQAPALVQVPAPVQGQDIHLKTPSIEPEIVTILDNKIESVLDNIILSIGC